MRHIHKGRLGLNEWRMHPSIHGKVPRLPHELKSQLPASPRSCCQVAKLLVEGSLGSEMLRSSRMPEQLSVTILLAAAHGGLISVTEMDILARQLTR